MFQTKQWYVEGAWKCGYACSTQVFLLVVGWRILIYIDSVSCVIVEFCISQYRLNVMLPELNDTCALDGDVWKNGSTWWKNECTQCSCNNGLSFCAERSPQCPELPASCQVTKVPQGKCCPVCVGEFSASDEMLHVSMSTIVSSL
jgi:hypothetical protein